MDFGFQFHGGISEDVSSLGEIPSITSQLLGPDSLSRIASCLGKPLYADECTTRQMRVTFSRVLVEVDVTQDIPATIEVRDPTGRSFEQLVAFDWKPLFCQTCLKLGHDCDLLETEFHPEFDSEFDNAIPQPMARPRRRRRNAKRAWVAKESTTQGGAQTSQNPVGQGDKGKQAAIDVVADSILSMIMKFNVQLREVSGRWSKKMQ